MSLAPASNLRPPSLLTGNNIPSPITVSSTGESTGSPPSPLSHLNNLIGQWYVAHTSSPIWRDKRNVVLSYTPISPPKTSSSSPASRGFTTTETASSGSAGHLPVLDDRITYQSSKSSKVETMNRTDTPMTATSPSQLLNSVWTWRGTGWLKLVTSRWEIIGYGGEAAAAKGMIDDDSVSGDGDGVRWSWMIVFAQKTLLSPAVINVYSRESAGLKAELLEAIKEGLRALGIGELTELVGKMYDVKQSE